MLQGLISKSKWSREMFIFTSALDHQSIWDNSILILNKNLFLFNFSKEGNIFCSTQPDNTWSIQFLKLQEFKLVDVPQQLLQYIYIMVGYTIQNIYMYQGLQLINHTYLHCLNINIFMKNNKIKNFQKRMPATTGSQYTDIDDLVQSNTESHLDMETVSINTIIRKAWHLFNKIGHTIFSIFST